MCATGADVHASVDGGPTPLFLAKQLDDAGRAGQGSAAQLVLSAVQRWSPQTHHLFPAASRARAWELARLGVLWSRSRGGRFGGTEQALLDVWRDVIMAFAVVR